MPIKPIKNSVSLGQYLPFGMLILPLLYFIFCWFSGQNQIINWQVLSELGEANAIIDRFQIGAINYEIPAKAFYVTEQYVASNMQINFWANWIWLATFWVGFSLIAAISTQLKGNWYYAISSFLIICIVSFGIDELLGRVNFLYTVILISLFISISFAFNSYFKNTHIALRLVTFLLFFAVIGLLIFQFAKEPQPFLLLAAKLMPAAYLCTVGFLFFVGYEVILGVLGLSTKGGHSKSLLNFSIFTLIFLINIGLTQLHNINWLDWDMLYLSPFLLLIIVVIMGYVNLKKKEPHLNTVFKNNGEPQWFFAAFAIITLGLCSYTFATGNDPATESLEDFIIYTQFVMGLCFFAYVFFNFFPLFRQNYDVAKVVFKPLQFPMYYFRAAAALIIFAMLMNNQFFPIMQSISGYYNALADHSVASEQYKLAETYYKTALGYERQNHKSNYGMASLAAMQGDNPTAGTFYRLAVQKKPTEYAFAALSNSLQREDMFFEAMFALRDGLKKFPSSGELQNNLALLFEKSKTQDSAIFYLEKAKLNAKKVEIPEANILSFWIKNGNRDEQKNALEKIPELNYNAFNANALALNLILQQKVNSKNIFQFDGDSTLNIANFAELNNMVLGKKIVRFPFKKMIENESNFNLADDLQQTYIFNEYFKGKKLMALETLQNQLVSDTTEKSRYKQVLFNTLLKKTREEKGENSIEMPNQKSALEALDRNPLNIDVLKKATQIINKEGSSKDAYEALLNAKKWMPENAELQKMYILQCFKIHMVPYAKDGMEALKKINQAEYNSFLPVYQAQMALVEKANEGFN